MLIAQYQQQPTTKQRKTTTMKTSRKKHRAFRLSSDPLYRQYEILLLEGTKKQIRVYHEARFNAYPKAVQNLLVHGGSLRKVTLSKKIWNKAHRVGYKAAIKAGYKYDFLAKY
ncbi:MAG: hypothetical protein EBU84_10960 [Actinobacteria bacterium]|nr:hypothetical protein [Actinomycetota bacterium]